MKTFKKMLQQSIGSRVLIVSALVFSLISLTAFAAGKKPNPAFKKPELSSFYSLFNIPPSSDFDIGLGNITKNRCTFASADQPSIYAGNLLLDCDGEVPHDETTITVDPADDDHVIGGYHSYQLSFVGSTFVAHVIGVSSVTFDGGDTWTEVTPPLAPYQFSGDPAIAFDGNSRLYYSQLASHEGQAANTFSAPDLVVWHSDDGGLNWSGPVVAVQGFGQVGTRFELNGQIANDKDYLTADKYSTSPYQNRVYATWTSFQSRVVPGLGSFFRTPIMETHSDDGIHWSTPKEISGFSSNCTDTISGQPNECDLNQGSIPTVAPNGTIYVAFENFNTPAENQYMVVKSTDGGTTWSNPVRVDTIYDVNYPTNRNGRRTLTGCQIRVNAYGNVAADPSDSTGNTLYIAWDDNRSGNATATDINVRLARSTDGGATWTKYTIDSAGNDQFFPWVSVASDGLVNVGYMDRSYSSGQTVCEYGFSLTRVTFPGATTDKTRVDTHLSDVAHSRWFSLPTDPQSSFIGDYNGTAVDSEGNTWSLWTDQRNLVPPPPSNALRNHGQHAVADLTAAP